MTVVLNLFNKIWNEGKLPGKWKTALIPPFVKPGKDPADAGSYRPKALTFHLGKLMEKMIVRKPVYFLECNRLLSPYQSGFHRGRSTIDSVEHVIKNLLQTLQTVEKWSYDWGFKISVAKISYMVFTKKKIQTKIDLLLYGQGLDRVSKFKYLGLWFDEKCKWNSHIKLQESIESYETHLWL